MSSATVVVAVLGYGASALLLSTGGLLFAALVRGSPAQAARSPERWLACGWLLIALALALPWAWRALGADGGAPAVFEIWGGPRVDGEAAPPTQMTLRWAGPAAHTSVAPLAVAGDVFPGAAALVLAGALVSLLLLALPQRRLRRFCQALPVVKRIGRVTVCTSDAVPTPFAARAAGRAFIVLPSALLADRRRLLLVIAHEAEHHRRRDLHAATALGVLRALFFWNPVLALWPRVFAELEDLACDRRVMQRRSVSALEYARALVWAAEHAVEAQSPLPEGARGMVMSEASFDALRRRIRMLSEMRTERGRMYVWLAAAAASGLLLATSWIVQAAVADHRVSAAEVVDMAARIQARNGFPVLADDGVVERLNGWVADAETREVMRAALARMPAYRGMIEDTLRTRGLPVELLGVPLAESGFDNEAHPGTPLERRSAGIWQIIPSTGRTLGLEVSAVRDERLDPVRATEAASAFLRELFARYGDWPVAIAAYNAGPRRIDGLLQGAPAGDARARVLAGDAEHARYVRAVMAALILIENPALLD